MANVKSRTRNGRIKVSNDERRAFQRTARRSYTRKDQGTNKEAVAMARMTGGYGETPETRHQKMIAAAIRRAKNGDDKSKFVPSCYTCGSLDMSNEFNASALTCKSCASDVKSALAGFIR